MEKGTISQFITNHYKHFNAAALVAGAKAYKEHIAKGGKMMITLAGAMSTAELGKSLAEMIRQDKVHIISCTGANLEEDIFNLVAQSTYKHVPKYRDLSPEQEKTFWNEGFNRVTDVCIPEDPLFDSVVPYFDKRWKEADKSGQRFFPHEIIYQSLLSGELEKFYDIDPKDSWILAAAQKKIPIIVPGWEDSSLGNHTAWMCMEKEMSSTTVKSGLDYFIYLQDWYLENSHGAGVGFFQIGGGIAGDFPICVVPAIILEGKKKDVPSWAYFCQISDSVTSYGSYSGAVPNEKISWGKLEVDTPSFVVESDATIVAPLMFAYVLGW